MGHPADFEDLKNAAIILFIVTSLVTIYRCSARYAKKLWGHDDSVALFSLFSFILFVIGSTYLANGSASTSLRVAGSYILIVGFYTPVWGARVSIILTVVRIIPWQPQRKILQWVAVFFVLLWAILTVQAYWVCEITQPGWKQIPGSICVLPKVVPITQLVTTVVSDLILITTPLMIARGVHARAVLYRLLFIFSVSIATTLASLAHVVLMMVNPGVWEAIFGGVEAAVSIIVCSMSVIIPAVLRALDVGNPFMQEDTVDLNLSTGFDITRTSMAGIELGLPIPRGTAITDSSGSEGAIGTMASRQRHPADLNVRDDRKHRLTVQASDGSLGSSTTVKVLSLVDGCTIADSPAQVRSTPVVMTDRGIGTNEEEQHVVSSYQFSDSLTPCPSPPPLHSPLSIGSGPGSRCS